MSRLYSLLKESTVASKTKIKPVSEKVGALTFHLYLKDGCPEGRETDFWKQARELVANNGTPTTDLEASIG